MKKYRLVLIIIENNNGKKRSKKIRTAQTNDEIKKTLYNSTNKKNCYL